MAQERARRCVEAYARTAFAVFAAAACEAVRRDGLFFPADDNRAARRANVPDFYCTRFWEGE